MAFRTAMDILTGTGSGLSSLTLLSGLALAASGTILAFLYLWGTLLRDSQMQTFVKHELYEMIFTAVIVSLIVGGIAGLQHLTIGTFLPSTMIPTTIPGVTLSPTSNIYKVTEVYFLLGGEFIGSWLELNYFLNIYVDQLASVTPYARPLGMGIVTSPVAGLASPIKQMLYNMSVALSVSYIVTMAQYYVYLFFLEAFLKYYLPIGLFLRCFTPTRRLGGSIIAIAITFLFFFPVLTTITFSVLLSPGSPFISFRDIAVNYITDAFNPNSPNLFGRLESFFTNNFSGSFIDLITAPFGLIGGLLQSLVGNAFLVLILFPISTVSMAFVLAFVAPVFNLIVLTQAARELSKTLGEEIDISSLTRLI